MSNEWQPIETAPKDQYIVAYIPNENPVVLYWGCYDSIQPCGDLYGWLNSELGAEFPYLNVTHWMPLPKPPVK
jgi:hypothetical protein